MTTPTLAAIHRGPVGEPARTLGWEALKWSNENLLQPDGPNAGEPWWFTPEQARFLLWFYALDENGRFVYRYAMLRRMKGWGKDPFAAALSCIEFVGPCRFAGWGKNGEPLSEEHPAAWVQVAAVSKDQTRNTMTLFPGMMSQRMKEEHGIDLGKEIIYAHQGQRRIEAVTSSPRALEGGRSTFTVKNESHHWIQPNEGLEMAAVIARNAAKSRDGSSRVLAISNAHAPGELSDAEHDWDAHQSDPAGILYDSLEAPDVALEDAETLRVALDACRGDSKWIDIDRLVGEIQDPRTPPNTARRYYLNQLAASEDRAFDVLQWGELKVKEKKLVEDGALITLGFDGSESRDDTALIGTEIRTGYQWVVGYWKPVVGLDGQTKIPVAAVLETVTATFERWDVWRMYADPFWWREWTTKWAGQYNRPGHEVIVEWNTTATKKMSFALLTYRNAMQMGELSHDGDERFAAGIRNAFKHVQQFPDDNGERMWTIEKETPQSPNKIDAAMAGCLSWQARMDAIASGVLTEKWHGILIPTGPQ